MRGLLLFARSRSVHWLLFVIVAGTVLSFGATHVVVPIDVAGWPRQPRPLSLIEILPLICAAVLAGLTRPVLVEWEALGRGLLHAYRLLLTACLVVVCQIPLVAGYFAIRPDLALQPLLTNAIVGTALAFCVAAMLGRVMGGPVALVLYLGVVVAQNISPGLAMYLPLAQPASPHGRWGVAVGSVVTTLAVELWTHGQSSLSRRLARNES